MKEVLEQLPASWWAICGLGIMVFVLFITVLLLYRKQKRFEAAYVSLQTFINEEPMDVLLRDYLNRVNKLEKIQDEVKARLDPIEHKLKVSIDRAELVRFRAFEDVGSDLSFSLALLNQEGNGVVLTSIYSRQEVRMYAKPVSEGKSTYSLLNEEKEAIAKAQDRERT